MLQVLACDLDDIILKGESEFVYEGFTNKSFLELIVLWMLFITSLNTCT